MDVTTKPPVLPAAATRGSAPIVRRRRSIPGSIALSSLEATRRVGRCGVRLGFICGSNLVEYGLYVVYITGFPGKHWTFWIIEGHWRLIERFDKNFRNSHSLWNRCGGEKLWDDPRRGLSDVIPVATCGAQLAWLKSLAMTFNLTSNEARNIIQCPKLPKSCGIEPQFRSPPPAPSQVVGAAWGWAQSCWASSWCCFLGDVPIVLTVFLGFSWFLKWCFLDVFWWFAWIFWWFSGKMLFEWRVIGFGYDLYW